MTKEQFKTLKAELQVQMETVIRYADKLLIGFLIKLLEERYD